jgi:hypothetical protein
MRACYPSIEKFEQLWPDGCPLTVENVRRAYTQQSLPPDWFCRHYVQRDPVVMRWYCNRLDIAWNKRGVALNRSWLYTYKLCVDTRNKLAAQVAQARHDRLTEELNHAYDEAHIRAVVMAVNRFRRRNGE